MALDNKNYISRRVQDEIDAIYENRLEHQIVSQRKNTQWLQSHYRILMRKLKKQYKQLNKK